MQEKPTILAAGGAIVRRQGTTGDAEVLLVHRPRYQDWSWPKGKCEPGETLEACALREVEEETGVHARIGPRLCEISYLDRLNRSKTVTYYALEILTTAARQPDNEVDATEWVALSDADHRLTNPDDRAVTRALLEYLKAGS